MRKLTLIFIFCLIISSSNAFAVCNCKFDCNCQGNVSKYYSAENSYRYLAEQIKKERLTISNALLLTDEQAKCRIELMRKNSIEIDNKIHQLYDETSKLKTLEVQGASNQDIHAQKETVKCVRKQIDTIIEDENKEFKKILDREQRAKLRMIQKLERKSVKECHKDYYKSNPKMRPFAMYKKTNCDCSEK